ncbi:MAG: hypothetical protein EAX96_01920 [Candidatus Lokiarchaeota archaeon]|nr:hypothetical protein [Candidatus Lokiarchaeota archaeon]
MEDAEKYRFNVLKKKSLDIKLDINEKREFQFLLHKLFNDFPDKNNTERFKLLKENLIAGSLDTAEMEELNKIFNRIIKKFLVSIYQGEEVLFFREQDYRGEHVERINFTKDLDRFNSGENLLKKVISLLIFYDHFFIGKEYKQLKRILVSEEYSVELKDAIYFDTVQILLCDDRFKKKKDWIEKKVSESSIGEFFELNEDLYFDLDYWENTISIFECKSREERRNFITNWMIELFKKNIKISESVKHLLWQLNEYGWQKNFILGDIME